MDNRLAIDISVVTQKKAADLFGFTFNQLESRRKADFYPPGVYWNDGYGTYIFDIDKLTEHERKYCFDTFLAYNPPQNRKKSVSFATPVFLYVIQQQLSGHTKIGISKDPHTRIKGIENVSGLSVDTLMLCEYQSRDAARDAEVLLHGAFKLRKIRGEWFRGITLNDIREILGE